MSTQTKGKMKTEEEIKEDYDICFDIIGHTPNITKKLKTKIKHRIETLEWVLGIK